MSSSQPSNEHEPKDELTESPLDILRKRVFRVLNAYLGWPVAAFLVAIVVVWAGWETISKMPGIGWALSKSSQLVPLPKARGDRFSIDIVQLEHDPNGIHRHLITDGLQKVFPNNEIEVLLLNRSITVGDSDHPQEAVKKGHDRARTLLRETKANVVIWGEALDDKPDGPMRLHWTLNTDVSPQTTTDKYRLSPANFDLPELFVKQLNDILTLLVGSEFSSVSGAVTRLPGFIQSVRHLLDSNVITDSQRVILKVILASVLVANAHRVLFATYEGAPDEDGPLREGVLMYQELLKNYSRDHATLEWAVTQGDLGTALEAVGRHESGTERVAELPSSLRDVLNDSKRLRLPIAKMALRLLLAEALEELADHESYVDKKKDQSREHFTQAIAIYQELVKEMPRGQLPFGWAYLQSDLGGLFWRWARHDSDTDHLARAVVAYREALKEYTNDKDPSDWTQTQYNLGCTLVDWASLEQGTEHLAQAVSAFQETLRGIAQGQRQPDWVEVQSELGNTLLTLGRRESGTDHLVQAVSVYQELKNHEDRKTNPYMWAWAEAALGDAYRFLGERESGTEQLMQAVTAYREALNEGSFDVDRFGWTDIQAKLGGALLLVATRESGTKHLEQAAAAFRNSLKLDSAYEPLNWAQKQYLLGLALEAMGEREQGTEHLQQAVSAYREALKERTREQVPWDWAMTQYQLGAALETWGERENSTEHLAQSVLAYEEALKICTSERSPYYHDLATQGIETSRNTLAKRQSNPTG